MRETDRRKAEGEEWRAAARSSAGPPPLWLHTGIAPVLPQLELEGGDSSRLTGTVTGAA